MAHAKIVMIMKEAFQMIKRSVALKYVIIINILLRMEMTVGLASIVHLLLRLVQILRAAVLINVMKDRSSWKMDIAKPVSLIGGPKISFKKMVKPTAEAVVQINVRKDKSS